jgi:hypothetical protein
MAYVWIGPVVSETAIIIISNLGTLMVAVFVNAVMLGIRWGEMKRDIQGLKVDMAEIKGMFTLKLKD